MLTIMSQIIRVLAFVNKVVLDNISTDKPRINVIKYSNTWSTANPVDFARSSSNFSFKTILSTECRDCLEPKQHRFYL